jgi:hypothetical protein
MITPKDVLIVLLVFFFFGGGYYGNRAGVGWPVLGLPGILVIFLILYLLGVF